MTSLERMYCLFGHDICNSSFPSMDDDCHGLRASKQLAAEMSTNQSGSGLTPISAGSGLDRTAIFWKLADQDWIGLRKFILV